MSYRLPAQALTDAVRHLCRYGDTDVFPHLPEIHFLHDCLADVVAELGKLDLDTHAPGSAFESLGPKSRYGFRLVHQLSIHDTVLLLAATIAIGPSVETRRMAPSGMEAFSYRFQLDGKGGIFQHDRTYRDWLTVQSKHIQSNLKIRQVVTTDISDFYARINFHRLENLLDQVAPRAGSARYIKRHIKAIRVKQSFGLPVGGSASRLLAELALTDTDRAINQEGLVATRFVDDFRIFLEADQSPYDGLAFLAEQLGMSEGLSLNASKTAVMSRQKYLSKIRAMVTDISEQAGEAAVEALTSELYFDDDPDPETLEKLKSLNLLEMLQEEAGRDAFDMGRIKVIFRALKLARPQDAVPYLAGNFRELIVFAKEVVLLMQVLEEDNRGCFDGLADTVIDAILNPPASTIHLIRIWLIELFVRGTVPISTAQLKRLEGLNTALESRQRYLIRGRMNDQNYFRMRKTAFGELSQMEQSCFIWGASCLPFDEYRAWLSVIAPMVSSPYGRLYLKWVEQNHGKLIDRLRTSLDDLPS